MRALAVHGPGDLRVEEREDPDASGELVQVSVALGGICGSDLHYFHEGRVADRVVSEPLVLGHELVGTVTGAAEHGDRSPALGTRVAIDPSTPCRACPSCNDGAPNLCADPRFLGSAAALPHTQGGFRELLAVAPEQCVAIPDDVPFESAVFAEPLAVAVHALARAGDLAGRAVLVTGAGPVGALLAALAARAGADVTVTDLHPRPLELAGELAPVRTIVLGGRTPLPEVDVAFEASGAPAALRDCVAYAAPRGRIVVVGMFAPAPVGVDVNALVTREVELGGSFRFRHDEFRQALGLIADGFDPRPLLSDTFPLEDGPAAFRLASDRERAMKVQLRIAR